MTMPSATVRRSIDALYPALQEASIPSLDAALMRLDGDSSYSYSSIRGHLTACSIYVTWDEINIRPLIPPTFENTSLSSAN